MMSWRKYRLACFYTISLQGYVIKRPSGRAAFPVFLCLAEACESRRGGVLYVCLQRC